MSECTKTEQENFWAGEFGDEYLQRNALTPASMAQRLGIWASIVRHCSTPVSSILELGANVGINLCTLSLLLPQTELTGLEINPKAAHILRNTLKSYGNFFRGG